MHLTFPKIKWILKDSWREKLFNDLRYLEAKKEVDSIDTSERSEKDPVKRSFGK